MAGVTTRPGRVPEEGRAARVVTTHRARDGLPARNTCLPASAGGQRSCVPVRGAPAGTCGDRFTEEESRLRSDYALGFSCAVPGRLLVSFCKAIISVCTNVK